MINKKFKHYKNGKIYQLLNIGRMESDRTVMVVYHCPDTSITWIRPYEEFFGVVTSEEGEKVKRFQEVE
jgi:hypothetical protein